MKLTEYVDAGVVTLEEAVRSMSMILYLGLRNLWPLVIGHIFTDLVWFA